LETFENICTTTDGSDRFSISMIEIPQ